MVTRGFLNRVHKFDSCRGHRRDLRGRCEDDPVERVRIDKWLWAARFFKTRGAATEAVLGGHVQVGGERVKPAKEIQVGDTIGIRRGELRWTVVVAGIA